MYRCTVHRYLCGIFLDDISTREQFAFLVYCYRVKAIFYNLCTVLYWRLCGVRRSTPIRLQFDRATTTVRYGLPVSSRRPLNRTRIVVVKSRGFGIIRALA